MLKSKAGLAAGSWGLGRRMKKEVLIMTSTFTLIFSSYNQGNTGQISTLVTVLVSK